MARIKYPLLAIIFATMFFIIFANKLPSEIEYRGHTLGTKETTENNSIKNFEIVSYKDKTGNHLLLFLMPEDDTVTTQELVEFYVGNFKSQGYAFKSSSTRYLGVRDDEVIYMTRAAKINAAIAYIEKGPQPFPNNPGDADDVFSSLANFSFE